MSKLITFKRDWADEFYVYGMSVFSDEEFTLFMAAINSIKDRVADWYFGTNEGYEYETVAELMDGYEIIDISEAELLTLYKCFPVLATRKEWGNIPARDLLEIIDEDDSTDEVEEYWKKVNEVA